MVLTKYQAADGACAGDSSAVDVTDNTNGTYALGFTPTRAGSLELAVTLESQGPASQAQRRRSFAGCCVPGLVAAASCAVSDAQTALAAGQIGRMRLSRSDAHGNAVTDGAAVPFVARARGPGQLRSSFRELPGGCAELAYAADAAGEYALSVHCAGEEEGTPVPGTPLRLRVSAACVSPAHCTAAFAGAHPSPLHAAGEELCVEFVLRDACGNASAELQGQRVELTAQGPERHELCADGEGAGALKLTPTTAGSYVLSARVGGQLLPGWPKAVHVQPARADAARCCLSGAALQASAPAAFPLLNTAHAPESPCIGEVAVIPAPDLDGLHCDAGRDVRPAQHGAAARHGPLRQRGCARRGRGRRAAARGTAPGRSCHLQGHHAALPFNLLIWMEIRQGYCRGVLCCMVVS